MTHAAKIWCKAVWPVPTTHAFRERSVPGQKPACLWGNTLCIFPKCPTGGQTWRRRCSRSQGTLTSMAAMARYRCFEGDMTFDILRQISFDTDRLETFRKVILCLLFTSWCHALQMAGSLKYCRVCDSITSHHSVLAYKDIRWPPKPRITKMCQTDQNCAKSWNVKIVWMDAVLGSSG